MDRPAQKQKPSANGPYQCTACQRSYTRVDHLARHVRSHLQERPFKCQMCHKSFGRPDLLKRHYSCHAGDQDGRSSKRQHSSSSRVFQACRACATAKLKCDDGKPCSRCLQRGIDCEYVADPHGPERAASDASFQRDVSTRPSESELQSAAEIILSPEIAPDMPPSGSSMDATLAIDVGATDQGTRQSTQESLLPGMPQSEPDRTRTHGEAGHMRQASTPEPSMSSVEAPAAVDPLGHDMSSFLLEVMMPNADPAFHFLQMKNAGVHGLLDFNVDADFDLNDTDYGFLNQLCGDPFSEEPIAAQHQHQTPQLSQTTMETLLPTRLTLAKLTAANRCGGGDGGTEPQQLPLAQPPHQRPLPSAEQDASGSRAATRQHIALGAEAFQRSALGLWLPAQQDCGDVQMENLSILGNEAGSPDTRIGLGRQCLRETLDRTTRDEFLAMILRTCRTERMTFVVRSFPDAGLLDDLVECFFSHHQQQIDSFIHMPTFRLNGQRPELVGAIVAAGATLTDVRALRKLGFAMQEAVRITLPSSCEVANATTRELWMLQSFLCELEVSVWSGIKRKMEIAESHTQVVVTMLRRAGRFQQPKMTPADPLPEDTGEVLRLKWLNWCEQESFKRLAFHAFICDAKISMVMLTNPIVSYSELDLSFPESRDLWMAEDPEQWKALCLNRSVPPNRRLSLLDFLRQDTELPDYYDVPLCSLVVLFGLWGMIVQHLQVLSIMNRSPVSVGICLAGEHGQNTAACNALWHQELLQMLRYFRIHMAECQMPPNPEIRLVLELLHVHLHCNFADLQLFAGKGDIDDARHTLPALQQWVGSRESRLAVWHAGQVLRAAAAFPAKQLVRFYAVAVYHAGLTLWVYGVIAQAKGLASPVTQPLGQQQLSPPESSASVPPSHPQTVCLDGVESTAVQRFIALGRGSPSVGMSTRGFQGAQVSLYDPVGVLEEVVVGILKRNLPENGSSNTESSLSPLVENLVQLLRGLAKAASSAGT